MLWVILLIAGFALVLWPFVLDFAYDPGPPGARWLETFYYSGYLATTLGLGDVIPLGPVFRLVSILEAFLGFALFSVGITYVLSIYTQQSLQTALASDIDHALRGSDPIDWRNPGEQELARSYELARDFAHRLARVNTANSQYPILHYFRHRDASEALPVQVGRLIRWVEAMESAAPQRDWLRGRSPFLSLSRAVDDYLRKVAMHLLPARHTGEEPLDREREHARLLHYLCYEAVPRRALPEESAP